MRKCCFCLSLILILVLLNSSCIGTKLEVENEESPNAEIAKAQLQKIHKQAAHMRYGECWTKALEVLQSGCRRLTDETQRRIAYAFARCHLKASGRDIPECPEETPIMECTDGDTIPDIAFNTYTEFFTHTQQICFHLQSQAWHEQTENTISRLADNSAEVATQLEHSAETAKEMMQRQSISLENQEILLQNEEKLKDSMQKSVLDVQKSYLETKTIINEQRLLFTEVFDRVAVLQKTVLGEFSSIYTFGFYVGSTLLAYILTSTTRTSSARIWLFLILFLNAVTERLITKHYVNDLDNSTTFASRTLGAFLPELIHEQTWLCRQFFSGFATLVLLVSICRYKDYNKINNTLLIEIKQKNDELLTFIHENIHDSRALVPTVKPEDFNNEAAGKQILIDRLQSDVTTLSHHQSGVVQSESDTTLRPDDPSLLIDLTDNESDASFRQSEVSRNDSDCSSVITVTTRSTHSAVARINSTPRASTPLSDTSPANGDIRSRTPLSVRRTRRTSSMIAVLDESIAFVEPPSDSFNIGGYSLRRRPQSPLVNRSIVQRETVAEFTSYMLNGLAAESVSANKRIRRHFNTTVADN